MEWLKRNEPPVAAAIIMAVLIGGWLAMPTLMHLVSGGGPVVGVAVGIAFILAFFAVLWLRSCQQRRIKGD